MRDITRRSLPLLVAAVAVLLAGGSLAAQYQQGDVFASVGSGHVFRYSPTGTLLQTLNTGQGGFTTGSAFDAAGNFYVTNFSANSVSEFDTNGNLIGLFGGGYPGSPESIVFDAANNAYVGSVGGGIRKFDSSGNFLEAYGVGGRIDFFDIAADQRTAYILREGTTIERWDLPTNTLLGTFATGFSNTFALRLLPGGELLVADRENVKRINSAGMLSQTYDVGTESTWFALNLDPDGTSFWSGNYGSGNLYRLDIASGSVLQTINTGRAGNLFGVSVFGEITVVRPPDTTVPEPTTIVLLGSGLAAVVAARLRRRRDEEYS